MTECAPCNGTGINTEGGGHQPCSDCAGSGERPVKCRRPKGEPEGYLAWHEWAERKSKTYRQLRCREHGLFHVWVRTASLTDGSHSEKEEK